jgi:hypothetical protein
MVRGRAIKGRRIVPRKEEINMPHYADGTEARVGDQVVGRLYNSGPDPKAGVIVSVTPGVESCNATVQFSQVVPTGSERPRMAVRSDPDTYMSRAVRGEQHGSAGPESDVYVCSDYCATNELTKVG